MKIALRMDDITADMNWDNFFRLKELFDKALSSGKAMVVDAYGLKFVPGQKFSHRAVLTTHDGEYRRMMASLSLDDGLSDPDSLHRALLHLSELLEAVVVLKASSVWIAYEGMVYIYHGANPSLGVAGSGDVLSGIIGALLAEGVMPSDSADFVRNLTRILSV